MNAWDIEHLMALANLGLCMAIAWGTLCRLNTMSAAITRWPVCVSYAVLMTAAIGVGTLPLWSEHGPGIGELMLESGFLIKMFINRAAWRDGPPEHTRRPARSTDPFSYWPHDGRKDHP